MTSNFIGNINWSDPGRLLDQAATWLNSLSLPAATPGLVASGLLCLPAAAALLWIGNRIVRHGRARQPASQASPVGELAMRLQAMELLVANATSEAALLRQRVDQLSTRQESQAAGNARTSLRQAIALSRHGATTRQLIDTCSLSQGEAHLIQTLYGRPATPVSGASQSEELH